jgi:tRNA(fMet)-specific endonuclease VapC
MIGNNLLVDTSIVVDLFKQIDQVVSIIRKTETVFIPVTVLGELYLGAHRASNVEKKMQQIQGFLLTCKLLNTENTTAHYYANVKAGLLRKGRPIPENDMWIAAVALQYDLPIYTFDAHFREVDGLRLFNPLSPV